MANWRESIAQNLVASAIWAAIVAIVGVIAVVLAKATPIIALFAPFSYLACLLLAWLFLALIAYVGARSWRALYPAAPVPPRPAPVVDNQASRDRKAIERLNHARDSATVAIFQGTPTSRARAFHEMDAAMVAIESRFDIGRLEGSRRLR